MQRNVLLSNAFTLLNLLFVVGECFRCFCLQVNLFLSLNSRTKTCFMWPYFYSTTIFLYLSPKIREIFQHTFSIWWLKHCMGYTLCVKLSSKRMTRKPFLWRELRVNAPLYTLAHTIYWRCNFETFLLEIIVWMQKALEVGITCFGRFSFFAGTPKRKYRRKKEERSSSSSSSKLELLCSISAFREMFKYSRN